MNKKHITVIGLAGKAGIGKTHIANAIRETLRETEPDTQVELLSFATPIKQMLGVLFEEKDKNAEVYKGKTLRSLLQTLGTEWGREMVDQDIWVNLTLNRKYDAMESGYILIDDVRFQNEVTMIKHLGGKTFCLQMEGAKMIQEATHKSENDLNNYSDEMIAITNRMHKEPVVVEDIFKHL